MAHWDFKVETGIDREICFKRFPIPREQASLTSSCTDSASIFLSLLLFSYYSFSLIATVAAGWVLLLLLLLLVVLCQDNHYFDLNNLPLGIKSSVIDLIVLAIRGCLTNRVLHEIY